MSSPVRWPDAALAGLACSMRSFSGPAMLAARGRISGRPRAGLLLAAAGELAVDKSSVAVDRWSPPGLVGRLGSGAYSGYAIAGAPGGLVAAISAGVGSYSTWRMRKLIAAATGLSDPVIAAGEDIIAYAAIAAATQEHPGDEQQLDPADDRPLESSLFSDVAKGLLAGLAGTVAMTIAQGAEFVLTSAEPSDTPAQVADRASRRLGLGKIRRRDRAAANQGMHWLYGASWGIPYGIVAASSRTKPEISGPVFGLAVWGVALAHQPALGIADVPWKRSLQSLSSEALFHVVYGIGAGAALRALRNR